MTSISQHWHATTDHRRAQASASSWLVPDTIVAVFERRTDAVRAAKRLAGGPASPAILQGDEDAASIRRAYDSKPRLVRAVGLLGDERETTEELARRVESGSALVTMEAPRWMATALADLGATYVLRVGRWVTERVD